MSVCMECAVVTSSEYVRLSSLTRTACKEVKLERPDYEANVLRNNPVKSTLGEVSGTSTARFAIETPDSGANSFSVNLAYIRAETVL
jgi:hypothetical protein